MFSMQTMHRFIYYNMHVFRCSMNKACDISHVVLSGTTIEYLHTTKYLGVLLCSDMKTSIDVSRQTVSFMHKPIHYYVTFVTVQMM